MPFMKYNETQPLDQAEPFESVCQIGDRLRERFDRIRYSTVIVHDGQQWTCRGSWETFDNGQWIEIDDLLFVLNSRANGRKAILLKTWYD